MIKSRYLPPGNPMLLAVLICWVLYSCQTKREIVQLHEDSGWCWYQDDRAIIDGNQLVFSGVSSNGSNLVSSYHLKTGQQHNFILNKDSLPVDDHNVGVLSVRPDGSYLSVYAGHGVDNWMRYRISTHPGDITQWEEEKREDVGARVTYSNLYRLDRSGITYNFHRGIGWDPNYMVSEDEGNTWKYGGQLFGFEGRPYVRYVSDHLSRIHFITTEEHPRNYNNSIYHGYMEDGRLYQTDGTPVDQLSSSPESGLSPDNFTRVFDGDKTTRADVAWTSDIKLNGEGQPYIAFSVTKDPIPLGETSKTKDGGFDHRYHYARWDGEKWNEHEIAYAGTRLYPGENEYTGLIALHPGNPDVVYISTNVHPKKGDPIVVLGEQRREIFRGTTKDGGQNWNWKAITKNSEQDNIRPIVLDYKNGEVVLWLQGRYSTYTDYDLKVMGWVPK